MLYWDNNATTALAPEVLEAMLPFLRENFFNPSASYGPAREVRRAMQTAREQVAALVGAEPEEIVFTSGGTEAANTALAGMKNVLTLATEHPATLHTAAGDACPVLTNGLADLPTWKELLPGHDGASFAWANHETGVLQPARSLALSAHEAGLRVHADLVQAAGKVPVQLHALEIDFASLSAHKLHGPKGVGALYIRRGTGLDKPFITGGDQEDLRRAGTENVPGIIGFGKAAELALAAADSYAAQASLRDMFVELLRAGGVEVAINGAAAPRLPHVLNMRVPGVRAEDMLHLLEPAGLLCSAGSACTSSHPSPSHVLLAMGLTDAQARESLRISLSRSTTAQDVEQGAQIFLQALRTLQSAQSPITGPVTVYR